MSYWKREYNDLRIVLEKLGWRCIKNEDSGLDEWYSQAYYIPILLRKVELFILNMAMKGESLARKSNVKYN